MPFNEKTPFGFLLATIFRSIQVFFSTSLAIFVLIFLLESCWLFISFADELKNNLHKLNVARRSEGNHSQVKQHLCNIVEVYSDVSDLIYDFNVIHEYIICVIFLWTKLSIASVMLAFLSDIVSINFHG